MSQWRPGQKEALVKRMREQGRIPLLGIPHGDVVAEENARLMKATAPKRGDVKPRRAKEPNQTEREYAAMLQRAHPDCIIRWEAITLRLASLLTYTPDYIVFLPGGSIECHEVKGGFIFSKALAKPRMAAEAFPWKFVLAQKRKGEWEISTLNGIWTRRQTS